MTKKLNTPPNENIAMTGLHKGYGNPQKTIVRNLDRVPILLFSEIRRGWMTRRGREIIRGWMIRRGWLTRPGRMNDETE